MASSIPESSSIIYVYRPSIGLCIDVIQLPGVGDLMYIAVIKMPLYD